MSTSEPKTDSMPRNETGTKITDTVGDDDGVRDILLGTMMVSEILKEVVVVLRTILMNQILS